MAVTVEIRSVNSRFLDLGFKLPEELRGLEAGLRDLLSAGLRRGKVELRVLTRAATESMSPEVADSALQQLAALQDEVRRRLPQAAPLSVHEALQWCRQHGAASPTVSDALVMTTAAEGLKELQASRQREGDKLKAVLLERTGRLRALAAEAEPLVPAVVERQQARFLSRWQEALRSTTSGAATGPAVDEAAARDRALQEATALAIRIDVAEELARLIAHLDEIERLLDQGGELGKRLDFLTQELHREANTLGSKSAALELSTLSMEMKVLIEQMREQVQNIE
jgi:uncharacterized protein (TIGR00255 family)